jgi:REP element-mobilizing transposase RayT
MANTYSKLYIQLVFAVNGRQQLIQQEWKSDLNRYISGIITNQGHKSINVNGMADHIHAFIGLNPTKNISDLVREMKSDSSNYINTRKLLNKKFSWQGGFGAFSYSQSHIQQVYNYIENQELHHQKKTFREEYHGFLKAFNINYEEKYLFDFLD